MAASPAGLGSRPGGECYSQGVSTAADLKL